MKARGLQGALISATVLIALTWSWSTSLQASLREHEAFTGRFRELQRLEHGLRLDVLRTRIGLLQTYDPLVTDDEELQATYGALFPLPSFLSEAERGPLTRDIESYGALLDAERDLVEQFKTRQSVLRNSLHYLPTLSAELVERARREPDGDAIAEGTQRVLEAVLLFNLQTSRATGARIEDALDVLGRTAEGHSPELVAQVALFDDHVRTILRMTPEVDERIDALFVTNVDGAEDRIIIRYDTARREATHRAQLGQVALYASSVALAALVVFAFYRLQKALRDVESLNTTLEARVASRTADLDERNGAMRRLLGQVAQGFATVNAQGIIGDERALILDRWLGPIAPKTTLFDVVRRFSADAAARLELGWPDLFEDVMPAEVVADMLRCTIPVGDLLLEIEIQVPTTKPMNEILLVVSDATARLLKERAEREGRELAAVLERITRDPSGFREYVSESEKLVSRVLSESTSTTELLQDLHTLKGGSFQSGLEGIGHLVHELETAVLAEGVLDEGGRTRLGDAWLALTARFEPLIRNESARLDISHRDLEELSKLVEAGAPRATLAAAIRALEDEKLGVRLDRLGQQLRADAQRRGVPVEVHIEAPAVRLPPARWSAFFTTLTHVARNAVAHGVESPEQRALGGKARAMRVCFAGHLDGEHLVLDITDDGAGIDWEAVAAKAKGLGLPAETRANLVDALFVDRLSTAKSVDSQRGRGVGLSAVLRVTRELGGQIDVESEPGLGTHFRFRVPCAAAVNQRAA